jgi:hypothetical protein
MESKSEKSKPEVNSLDDEENKSTPEYKNVAAALGEDLTSIEQHVEILKEIAANVRPLFTGVSFSSNPSEYVKRSLFGKRAPEKNDPNNAADAFSMEINRGFTHDAAEACNKFEQVLNQKNRDIQQKIESLGTKLENLRYTTEPGSYGSFLDAEQKYSADLNKLKGEKKLIDTESTRFSKTLKSLTEVFEKHDDRLTGSTPLS